MSIEAEAPDRTRPAAAVPPPAPASDAQLNRLLAHLLGTQQQLDTPAARAGAAHDTAPATGGTAEFFRELIPLSAPAPGEQYAFEVNLDACSGCKSCVAACHSLNGLDAAEAWRDVGLLVSTGTAAPWQQTVTTACHHCAEPACLLGCPVAAYEKDPATGIVRHLDDQCIGCSYCILKCPYDVPKYNPRLGIVRKCDMCHQRLAVGEAPACAQACPTHAIRIVTVPAADARTAAPPPFLPGAPDPAYTRPTTRFVTARGLPAAVRAADTDTVRVQPAHGPLVAMLVLTQLGVGFLATAPLAATTPADLAAHWVGVVREAGAAAAAPLGAALFLAGLAASVLHLGQPLRAWRVFLGWRTSWLSREALLFGLLPPLLLAAAAFPADGGPRGAAVAAGCAAVAASAMVYIDTRRRFWAAWPTAVRFGGTVLVAALLFRLPAAAAGILSLKLAFEWTQLRGPGASARLLAGPLRRIVRGRFAAGLAAAALAAAALPWLALPALLAGEILERLLFFRAVDAPKMPGLPTNA